MTVLSRVAVALRGAARGFRFTSWVAAAALLACGLAAPAGAATPDRGTLTATATRLDYEAGPFVVTNPTPIPLWDTGPECGWIFAPAQPCDSYALTVSLPSGYAARFPEATVRITLTWPDSGLGASDYDLYVYKGDVPTTDGSETPLVNAASAANPEVAAFDAADGDTVYTIKVVPYTATGESVAVNVELVPGAESTGGSDGGDSGGDVPSDVSFGSADPASPGAPRYQTFYAPAGSSAESDGGEYSIGYNPATRRIMTMSIGFPGPVWRLTPPEVVDPSAPESGEALWEDKSSLWKDVPQVVSDPILWTDGETGRTFAANLTVGPNISYAFSDDDGETWTNIGTGIAGADHETVVSGPYPEGSPYEQIARLAGYAGADGKGHAVYFCSQDVLGPGGCTRSDDGGLIWGPMQVAYDGSTCGGLHGHLRIAPDGAAYLPIKDCGANQGGTFTTDAGDTWTQFQVPGTAPQGDGSDPSFGIDDAGTLYYCYVNADGRAHVKVGRREGDTLVWGQDRDLGQAHGITNAAFPEAVGGDAGRAACGFLGTNDPSPNYQSLDFAGVWYLYIATTIDGGQTWTTVNATPNDPVQGAGGIWQQGGGNLNRNLLDFNEVTIDDKGRVLFGYNDGCVTQACIADPSQNDFVAHQRVARQSGGHTLRAAYDSQFASLRAPGRPSLSGTQTAQGLLLTWKIPDHGGAEILRYSVTKTSAGGAAQTIDVGDKARYLDTAADAASATYTVTAINAVGSGQASNVFSASGTSAPAEDSCAVPGITVATDASGDDAPPLPTAASGQGDILSVNIAEPKDLANKLVFTLKVASLESLPPNMNWTVGFEYPAAKQRFVFMETDEFGVPSYSYAEIDATSGSRTTLGTIDSASGYTAATGEIRLVVANSLVGGPAAGAALTQVQGETTQLVGSSVAGGLLQTIDESSVGSYSLRAANACDVNHAPTAVLSVDKQTGDAPLDVVFSVQIADEDAGDVLGYTLDFGDGTAPATGSASGTVSHRYTATGLRTAVLTVTDGEGAQDTDAVSLSVTTAGSTPLTAQLAADRTDGPAPLTVRFDASATSGCSRSCQYLFVYGDGQRSAAQSSPLKTYTYDAAGTYHPHVVVTDGDGNADTSDALEITTTVEVVVTPGNETVAMLTIVGESTGPAPLTVRFDGSRSIAADGRRIVSYRFDFGDGSAPVQGAQATATHVYTVPGTYEPTLTVTDDAGDTAASKASVQAIGGSSGGNDSAARRGGGGALGWIALLPLLMAAVRRRPRNC